MGFTYRRIISAVHFIFIIVSFYACSQQYRYEVPKKTDDGWETASLSEAGVDPKKINELVLNILNEKYKNIHSVILVKNGKLIFEKYFEGYHIDKLHPIQSDTKSITSILIGIALDQKIVPDLDRKIYDFFSDYKGTKWIDEKYDITIKHALTMTAGLEWDERAHPYNDSRNDNTAMNNSIDWIKYILNKNTIEPPGKRFNYTSGLSILLGAIIKNTSGMSADGFAETYLFKPLGITDHEWYKNWDNTIHTGGGLKLRPRDMAKIGYMMLREGNWQGKRIVSSNWVHESTHAHIKTKGHDYGYQWWSGKTIKKNRIIEAFWAAGAGGQYIFVLPELDLVVVFTAKHRKNPGSSERAFNMLSEYIIPAVLHRSSPPKTLKIAKSFIDTYAGTYQYEKEREAVTVTIFQKDDRLYAKRNDDEDTAALFPFEENQFYGISKDIGDFRIKFVMDNNGEVDHFNLQFDRRFVFLNIPFAKVK